MGVAPNKFLAKLASDLEKPDGFVVITQEEAEARLAPLPVSRLWGVGKVTEEALREGRHSHHRRTSCARRDALLERAGRVRTRRA